MKKLMYIVPLFFLSNSYAQEVSTKTISTTIEVSVYENTQLDSDTYISTSSIRYPLSIYNLSKDCTVKCSSNTVVGSSTDVFTIKPRKSWNIGKQIDIYKADANKLIPIYCSSVCNKEIKTDNTIIEIISAKILFTWKEIIKID